MKIRLPSFSLDPAYITTFLLVAPSGVYLTRLGVSPIYIASLLGMMALLAFLGGGKAAAPMSRWAEALGLFALMVPLAVYQASLDSGVGNILNLVLGPMVGGVVLLSARRLDHEALESIARAFCLLTLLVTTVECVYRLTHPDLTFLEDASHRSDDAEDIAFYAYKFNSLMYLDSNFVGLQLALLFAFMLGLPRLGVRVSRFQLCWTFLLTALTLSRASIVAAGLVFLVARYMAGSRAVRALLFVTLVGGFFGVLYLVQNDASFLTKFDILERFASFEGSASALQVLFGVGVGRAVDVLGIGAHNIVVSYVVELGCVATAIFFLYWTWLMLGSAEVLLLVVVWLVNGFSLTTFAVPYMYASASMLRLLKDARLNASPGSQEQGQRPGSPLPLPDPHQRAST